ncbi:MAG: thioredoxin [Acidobacteriota bacterium]|nr:thioredoxin [Acidobacteriota bacterium]
MATASSVQIVRCPKCDTNNRVVRDQTAAKAPICGRCKTLLFSPAQPITVTDGNYSIEVESSPLPVLLDLWAPWCGPCRMMSPIIDQLAEELAGQIRVGKLNVDENPQTAALFRVQGIPTLLILKNGREVGRLVGAQSKEAIHRRLQAVV